MHLIWVSRLQWIWNSITLSYQSCFFKATTIFLDFGIFFKPNQWLKSWTSKTNLILGSSVIICFDLVDQLIFKAAVCTINWLFHEQNIGFLHISIKEGKACGFQQEDVLKTMDLWRYFQKSEFVEYSGFTNVSQFVPYRRFLHCAYICPSFPCWFILATFCSHTLLLPNI